MDFFCAWRVLVLLVACVGLVTPSFGDREGVSQLISEEDEEEKIQEDQNFQAEQQDNRVGSAKRDIFLLAAGQR